MPDDQLDTPLSPAEQSLYDDICENVSTCVKSNDSRLFAVVHIAGKQFKVTSEDLISIKTPFIGTQPGDVIRLEKVLLVGVSVYAMVVEKTLEHPHLWYQFHRRRRHRKMRIFQDNLVTLRIKDISVHNI
ncbi:39S ribosomal protein L21, mitochondrial [Sparganum proliferum]